MSSRQKMKKRRARLARAERKRFELQRRREQYMHELAESMRRLHEESLRCRNAWHRRLLRRLTGGLFG